MQNEEDRLRKYTNLTGHLNLTKVTSRAKYINIYFHVTWNVVITHKVPEISRYYLTWTALFLLAIGVYPKTFLIIFELFTEQLVYYYNALFTID